MKEINGSLVLLTSTNCTVSYITHGPERVLFMPETTAKGLAQNLEPRVQCMLLHPCRATPVIVASATTIKKPKWFLSWSHGS